MASVTVEPAAAPPAATGGDGAAVEIAALELRHLQRDLLRAISAEADWESVLSSIGVMLSAAINPVAIDYYVRDSNKQLALTWQRLPGGGHALARALQAEVLGSCNAACTNGHLQVKCLGEGAGLCAVAVPVFLRKEAPAALALVLPTATQILERAMVILQLVASHLTLWHVVQESAGVERDALTAAALLEIMEKLGGCDDVRHACYTLVSDLKEHLGWDDVALGLCQGRKEECRLQAISGRARFDRNSDRTRAFEAALDEAILRGSLAEWPPPGDAAQHSARALRHLCALSGSQLAVSAPLHDQGQKMVGAWIFLAEKEIPQRQHALGFLRASAAPVGSALQLCKRAQRSRVVRLVRTVIENRRCWQTRAAVAAVCLLALLLALPVHYKVGCECEIQPVTRRYVVAPFDGRLDKALATPGDVIARDDVLARMDGQDMRWELAGLVAEHGRAAKRRDAAMATHDVVTAQLAKLEMQQLQSNMKLLEHRTENLEIKSPVDGIVISGDQQRAEGAPLTVGQSLFEIAPLDEMIVEVAVPEEEINYVSDGLDVVVRLDAFPRRTWSGTIGKVNPRSERREDENVFIAEVRLDNPDDLLRPGMNGRAKVVSGRRPLGWNLFHKPWETMLRTLGW